MNASDCEHLHSGLELGGRGDARALLDDGTDVLKRCPDDGSEPFGEAAVDVVCEDAEDAKPGRGGRRQARDRVVAKQRRLQIKDASLEQAVFHKDS